VANDPRTQGLDWKDFLFVYDEELGIASLVHPLVKKKKGVGECWKGGKALSKVDAYENLLEAVRASLEG
jgi:hypothetical protein